MCHSTHTQHNSLPKTVTDSNLLGTFETRLKSYFFLEHITDTHYLPPAPLKLRPNGAIQIYYYYCYYYSATEASLSPGHVFGTVFRPTCATRTLHTCTTFSGGNSKRFCFNVASGPNETFAICAIQIPLLTYLLTQVTDRQTDGQLAVEIPHSA